jgi:peroxiredoxin
MRTYNNYLTIKRSNDDRAVRQANRNDAPSSRTAKSEHVVFFFMCRSTCSHCWKQAIALGQLNDQLRAHNTSVMLVGDGRYKESAQRLVKQLGLPFQYMADNGALRRYYHVDAASKGHCSWAIILVDRQGIVRYCRFGCPSHNLPDFPGFLAAVRMTDLEPSRHIMGRSKLNGCDNSVELVSQ